MAKAEVGETSEKKKQHKAATLQVKQCVFIVTYLMLKYAATN